MLNIKEFYELGLGDNLIKFENYPAEIISYLKAERNFLTKMVTNFSSIIEIGCMNGRYFEWTIKNDKYYIGIDIVERYISIALESAKKLNINRNRYAFYCDTVVNLPQLLETNDKNLRREDVLIFFPFNSFGNIEEIESVFSTLEEIKIKFFISSYQIGAYANRVREAYYRACKYKNIKKEISDLGVRFKSDDGLNTISYSPNWLRKKFSKFANIKSQPLSEIGIAYIGQT